MRSWTIHFDIALIVSSRTYSVLVHEFVLIYFTREFVCSWSFSKSKQKISRGEADWGVLRTLERPLELKCASRSFSVSIWVRDSSPMTKQRAIIDINVSWFSLRTTELSSLSIHALLIEGQITVSDFEICSFTHSFNVLVHYTTFYHFFGCFSLSVCYVLVMLQNWLAQNGYIVRIYECTSIIYHYYQ